MCAKKCNPTVTWCDPALGAKLLRHKCVSAGAPSCPHDLGPPLPHWLFPPPLPSRPLPPAKLHSASPPSISTEVYVKETSLVFLLATLTEKINTFPPVDDPERGPERDCRRPEWAYLQASLELQKSCTFRLLCFSVKVLNRTPTTSERKLSLKPDQSVSVKLCKLDFWGIKAFSLNSSKCWEAFSFS